MKKGFLFFLMLCMMVNTTLCVYADLTPNASGSAAGSSTITAQTKAVNQPEFTVTIPENIAPSAPIDRTPQSQNHDIEFSVSVSNLQYLNGMQIQVLLSAPNDQFVLLCGEHELPFEVYRKTGASSFTEIPETGGEFATFLEDGTATGIVRIDSYNITHEGQYGGYITFTVQAVEKAGS
ncbi:MAG: hypothetical protein IJX62_06780 [Clostridia bacterium]|nr:hypothetical protein [Clostridia bacterium]